MDIYYCPRCNGKPYTDNPKKGTKCPVCGAELKYENVRQAALVSRSRLVYPDKKNKKSADRSVISTKRKRSAKSANISVNKPEQINENITVLDKKVRSITGTVLNIRPTSDIHRDFITKLRHYILYNQSFSDTLYSFDIKYIDENNHSHISRVNIYGDYRPDGPTICSGIEHTVTGRAAVKNLSEEDNNIFFAKSVRNMENDIRFMHSPAGFFSLLYVLFFAAVFVLKIFNPLIHGTLLDEIRRMFIEFVPSAKAAVSMFSISFILISAIMLLNSNKSHIYYNFNTACVYSLISTVLFFMKYPLISFSDLSASESFSSVFACLTTASLSIVTAVIIVWLIWKIGCRIIRR